MSNGSRSAAIVRLNRAHRTFTDTEAGVENVIGLQDVSFSVREGSFTFITGPSGAGKTTLVRLLYADLLPTKGEIFVCGRNTTRIKRSHLPLLRREVGVILQDFHLIERKSARDNVSLALEVTGVSRAEALKRADAALEAVRLAERRSQAVIALSGGEKQRVALARALVGKPRLIVADEPTGNLDPSLTDEVFRLLEQAAAKGATVLVATHDLRRVDSSGRDVVYLTRGRIAAVRGDVEAEIR